MGSSEKQIQSQYITWGEYVEEPIEKQLLKRQVEKAISSLKLISAQETDTSRKIDIDYVITILTNKPYGSMPF